MNMPRTGRPIFVALLAALALLRVDIAHAQEARQYKLETAFLYNFLNYITWPGLAAPESLTTVTICIQPGDPLSNSLSYIKQRMSGQRDIEIREWKQGTAADKCQILFVRNSASLPNDAGVLMVAEDTQLRPGIMIALNHEESRIAIRMNNTLLTKRGFQASSRLLSLAEEVK